MHCSCDCGLAVTLVVVAVAGVVVVIVVAVATVAFVAFALAIVVATLVLNLTALEVNQLVVGDEVSRSVVSVAKHHCVFDAMWNQTVAIVETAA